MKSNTKGKKRHECKIVTIRLNRDTESDLVEWFEKNPGTASTKIKQMIRDLIG